MTNPNIAMLENVISAAVSTQYKEVPPTEEEFLALAQTMRTSMSMFSVTETVCFIPILNLVLRRAILKSLTHSISSMMRLKSRFTAYLICPARRY